MKSLSSEQAEFRVSEHQMSADEKAFMAAQAGSELIAIRYGKSHCIQRAHRVTVLATSQDAIIVAADAIYGECVKACFSWRTGVELGKTNARASRKNGHGAYWRLHAVTGDTEEFLADAEIARYRELLEYEFEQLLHGISVPELQSAIAIIKIMRKEAAEGVG